MDYYTPEADYLSETGLVLIIFHRLVGFKESRTIEGY